MTKKDFIILGLILLTVAVILVIVLRPLCSDKSLFFGKSDYEIIKEYASPHNRDIVTLYQEDAGATTQFHAIVTIRGKGEKPDYNNGVVFVSDYSDNIRIKWVSEHSLQISYPNKIVILEQKHQWKDIRVTYLNAGK